MSTDNQDSLHSPGHGKGSMLFMLGMCALLISCVILFVTVRMYSSAHEQVAAPVGDATIDTAGTLSAIGKLTDLPTGETPQLVPIPDLTALQDEPFFSRARVGDILVLYTANHLAILYDPAQNKIVNMNRITVIIPPSVSLQ